MADFAYVSGLKELQARIEGISAAMGERTSNKIVSSSLRVSAVTLQKSVQAHLRARGHVKTGTLVNNIIAAKVRSPQPGTSTYIVTVRRTAKKYKANKANQRSGRSGGTYHDYGPLFYARFSEFGTSHEAATPWMRPAFEETKGQLPEEFRDALAAKLDAL